MKRSVWISLACGASLVLVFIIMLLMNTASKSFIALAAGNTYIVNSTADTSDMDLGDGLCADTSGHCTLRAAIMQANYTSGPETITLPAGVYLLTRAGDDDAAVLGDLDIADDLIIQGVGSASTIVDGNGNVTGDRVFQILQSARHVYLKNLTIRNGKKVSGTFDEGGGLYWEGAGSHLDLVNVLIENNTSRYGGGVYLSYSANGDIVNLNHVVIYANKATAASGGLGANLGDFAGFYLTNSQVYSNTAYEGGGVYIQNSPVTVDFQAVRIESTNIFSNTASLSAGLENHSGDSAVPVTLFNDHLSNNNASFYGGGIGNYGTLDIISTTVDANVADVRGGGLYNYEGGHAYFSGSTVSRNLAQFGGGIFSELFIYNNASLMMMNSTLSGNTASRNGGGLYALGGHTQFLNATIADNQVLVPAGVTYPGVGGGIYITGTASLTAGNTIIADNTHRLQTDPPTSDDCFTSITPMVSLGYNLIETPTNCTLSGTTLGLITGQAPMLGPLKDNGGPTETQSPLAGSPVIDAGQIPYCTDANGTPIMVDQRGYPRPNRAACDIGAVEYYPLLLVYLPTLIK